MNFFLLCCYNKIQAFLQKPQAQEAQPLVTFPCSSKNTLSPVSCDPFSPPLPVPWPNPPCSIFRTRMFALPGPYIFPYCPRLTLNLKKFLHLWASSDPPRRPPSPPQFASSSYPIYHLTFSPSSSFCECKCVKAELGLVLNHYVMSDSSVTPWTTACQASLSMGSPRQEYRSRLPFPPPGDLPDPGIKPTSPALARGFCTTEPPGKPHKSREPCLFPSITRALEHSREHSRDLINM